MAFPDIVTAIKNPSSLLNALIPEPVYIGTLEISVLMREVYEEGWDITTHPVGKSYPIASARVKRPPLLILEGWLLDTPLSPYGVTTQLAYGEGFNTRTWREKRDELVSLLDSEELLRVVTRLNSYPDMHCRRHQVAHDKDSSRGYPFVLEFEKILIITSLVQSVDDSQIPRDVQEKKEDRHSDADKKKSKKKDLGKKKTETATEADIDPLRKLADGLGVTGFLGL